MHWVKAIEIVQLRWGTRSATAALGCTDDLVQEEGKNTATENRAARLFELVMKGEILSRKINRFLLRNAIWFWSTIAKTDRFF